MAPSAFRSLRTKGTPPWPVYWTTPKPVDPSVNVKLKVTSSVGERRHGAPMPREPATAIVPPSRTPPVTDSVSCKFVCVCLVHVPSGSNVLSASIDVHVGGLSAPPGDATV